VADEAFEYHLVSDIEMNESMSLCSLYGYRKWLEGFEENCGGLLVVTKTAAVFCLPGSAYSET
jgi:hypothetical protein